MLNLYNIKILPEKLHTYMTLKLKSILYKCKLLKFPPLKSSSLPIISHRDMFSKKRGFHIIDTNATEHDENDVCCSCSSFATEK